MEREFWFRIILFILLFIFSEITAFFSLSSLWYKKTKFKRQSYARKYCIFSIIFVLFIFPFYIYTASKISKNNAGLMRQNFFLTTVILLVYIPKFIAGLFWIISVIISFIIRFINKILFKGKEKIYYWAVQIYKILNFSGLFLAFCMLIMILYGMSFGITNYKIKNIVIKSENIPASFDNFTIAQISDTHLGSFNNIVQVEKGLNLISQSKPDLIVFTGDMVNADPYETSEYIDKFQKLQAPFGKYAVLGNHDLNNFLKWKNKNSDSTMGKEVSRILNDMGFTVLRNSNAIIYKNSDSISISGVDNFGTPPFTNYADIDKASRGIQNFKYKILLLHDSKPLKDSILPYYKFNLALSGHTHGMQIGINFPWFKWSPSSFIYKYYLGLYPINDCDLYINAGFGFIGFAARIGISPEITIIKLKSKSSL